MSTKISNTFTTYELTEAESQKGYQLNDLNRAVLQNLRCSIAEEKLNLVFTPNDILSYTQQEAHLKGQLDVISHLLAMSEDTH